MGYPFIEWLFQASYNASNISAFILIAIYFYWLTCWIYCFSHGCWSSLWWNEQSWRWVFPVLALICLSSLHLFFLEERKVKLVVVGCVLQVEALVVWITWATWAVLAETWAEWEVRTQAHYCPFPPEVLPCIINQLFLDSILTPVCGCSWASAVSSP